MSPADEGRRPRNSGEWAKAIAEELRFKRIANALALTAFRLATAINWAPREPERQGRPALYWGNKKAAASLGIDWRTFERHRAGLRKAGLIDKDQDGNLVPLLPDKTDAVRTDADKTVGPYKEQLFKEDLSRSSYEVDTATVSSDVAGAWPKSPDPTDRGQG